MTQRGRQQLELTPSEYQDAKRGERAHLVAELEGRLERAFNHREPWYMWILWRRNREHHHGLRNEKNEPVACPVPGCDEGHQSIISQDAA